MDEDVIITLFTVYKSSNNLRERFSTLDERFFELALYCASIWLSEIREARKTGGCKIPVFDFKGLL